jgi:hypothetical protein
MPKYADSPTLGAPVDSDVFVTAAADIAGITTAADLARRLSLFDKTGALRSGPFSVTEFSTPASGLASPILRSNPGFTGNGLTGGGAREFVLPNLKVKELTDVASRTVP